MLDLMYELPGQRDVRECVITPEVIQGKEKPQLLFYDENEEEKLA